MSKQSTADLIAQFEARGGRVTRVDMDATALNESYYSEQRAEQRAERAAEESGYYQS